MTDAWSDEHTDDPVYADDRNFYKVEAWSRGGCVSLPCFTLAITSIRQG
jgi:hypothetical protein